MRALPARPDGRAPTVSAQVIFPVPRRRAVVARTFSLAAHRGPPPTVGGESATVTGLSRPGARIGFAPRRRSRRLRVANPDRIVSCAARASPTPASQSCPQRRVTSRSSMRSSEAPFPERFRPRDEPDRSRGRATWGAVHSFLGSGPASANRRTAGSLHQPKGGANSPHATIGSRYRRRSDISPHTPSYEQLRRPGNAAVVAHTVTGGGNLTWSRSRGRRGRQRKPAAPQAGTRGGDRRRTDWRPE